MSGLKCRGDRRGLKGDTGCLILGSRDDLGGMFSGVVDRDGRGDRSLEG